MSRSRAILVLLTACGGAGGLAWFLLRSPGASGQPDASEWPVIHVSPKTVSASIVASGTVKSQVGAEVKVGSQVSGIVKRLYVKVGDKVRKGQILAVLDESSLRSQVDMQRANVAKAETELNQAKRDMRRAEELASKKIIAPSALEASQVSLDIAVATLNLAKATAASAEIELAKATILAPIQGTVASVSTYEGETVAASFAAPTFVTIVDLARLEVQAFVDESDIRQVTAGQATTFRLDAFPGTVLDGQVRAINPKAILVNNVVDYIVVVDITDAKNLVIRPEMTAYVDFVVAAKVLALSLPRSAVISDGDNSYVVVRTMTGWVKKSIKVGIQTPQQIEVSYGLKPGDTVLSDARLWRPSAKDQ